MNSNEGNNESGSLSINVLAVADDLLLNSVKLDDKFVRPWTGIVVNLPTRLVVDGRSKLRDGLLHSHTKGLNPISTNYLWDNSSGGFVAFVEFEQGFTGFRDAMSFERAYEADNHGKKGWLCSEETGKKCGLYAWIARVEDYDSGNGVVGEYLRSNDGMVIKDVMGIMEEEFKEDDENACEVIDSIEVKTNELKKMGLECTDGVLSLCKMMEEKETILRARHRDNRRVRLTSQVFFRRCFESHENLKLQLESKTKETESYCRTEYEKLKAEYESEIKKLTGKMNKMQESHKREVKELEFQKQSLTIDYDLHQDFSDSIFDLNECKKETKRTIVSQVKKKMATKKCYWRNPDQDLI